MSSEPDASVLRRSIDQPDGFALLFDRHFAEVHRYLRRRLGDELGASWRRRRFCRRSAPGGASPATASVLPWLYGITTNLVRMNHRTEEQRLRAYARGAAGLGGYEPAIAVEDRLDAEALGPAQAVALSGLSPARSGAGEPPGFVNGVSPRCEGPGP